MTEYAYELALCIAIYVYGIIRIGTFKIISMRKWFSYCAALSLFEFPSFSSKRITCVKCLFE